MMSNEEMVQRVFERSDEYFRKKEKQRAIIKKGGTIMSVTGIIIAVSLAILSANTQNVVPPEEPSRIDVVGTMQSSTETTASTTATIASSAYGSESNENNTETTSITTTKAPASDTTTNTTSIAAVTTAVTTVETTAYEKATSATTTTPISTTALAVSETTAVTTTTSTTTYTTTTTEETTVETGIILAIDTVEVTPGELAANNNRVFVNISIKNNPGFIAIGGNIKYDERLTLRSSKESGILIDDSFNVVTYLGGALGYINLAFYLESEIPTDEPVMCEDDGVFWTLCFELPEDAAVGDEYYLPIDDEKNEELISDVITYEGTVVPTLIDGKITVVEGTRGDVNGDGEVNISDASAILSVYASGIAGTQVYDVSLSSADVNRDGVVDMTDAQDLLLFYAKYTAGMLDDWFEGW